MKKSNVPAVIKAGLIVGTLDILAAFIQFYINTGKSPEPVLKFIASGVFGSAAFTGGNEMLIWGLVFHYAIAMIFTIIFFFLVKKFSFVLNNRLLTGFVYGIIIWGSMRFIVLPLSHTPSTPLKLKGAIIAVLILIICIGIPLSYMAKKILKKDVHR